MKRSTFAIAATMMLTTAVAACGDDDNGGNAAGFSTQLGDVCRTLDRGLGNLDLATSLDDVKGLASDASKLYEDAVTDMKKLKPSNAVKNDFEDLVGGFEDQIDLLDQISRAAGQGDGATVQTKLTSFLKISSSNADLADDLEASRCNIRTDFTNFAPVDTVPPDTVPPDTLPPDTVPPETVPVTQPPTTQPPATSPPVSDSNKFIIDAAASLVPAGDYSFQDAPPDTITSWQTLLDLSTVIKPQPGTIGGVDVFDHSNVNIGRVFFLVSDTVLAPGSVEDLIPIVAVNSIAIPATKAGVAGIQYESNGTFFFMAARDDVIVWVLSTQEVLLDPSLTFFFDSLGG